MRIYIALSSIIHINFSYAFTFIDPYLSLVLFKGIAWKQLTEELTLKTFIQGRTEGELSECAQAVCLEKNDMFYQKQKLEGLSQKPFTLML